MFLRVSSRVSFHALGGWGLGGGGTRQWGRSVGWVRSRGGWWRDTYMDSSSLLAHRLTVEPSLSRMTMRFSRGLFSGGATSAQSTTKLSITGEKHCFKCILGLKLIVRVTSFWSSKPTTRAVESTAVPHYRHTPGRRSRPRTTSWGWRVAPALAGCLSCRSRDFRRSRGHTSWASSVWAQTLQRRKPHAALTD